MEFIVLLSNINCRIQ